MATTGIPVLNYHAIDGNIAGTQTKRNVSVSLAAFTEHIEWLSKEGYKSVTKEELRAYLFDKKPVTGKRVLITFDDGYYSLYQHALPILSRAGYTATLFLSTSFIGKQYDQGDFEFVKHDRQLTWDEIKELAANGWSIQSHGNNHFKMNGLTKSALIEEVTVSKNIIEKNLGSIVDEFAFPYGLYNSGVIDRLKDAGYKMAYSVHSGKLRPSSNKFRIPRIEINNMDTMESFTTKVLTGHISPEEEKRARIRNIIYANTTVKDVIEKWTPYFGFGNH